MEPTLYAITFALLLTHQVDSAYWKEWELLHIPGGPQLNLVLKGTARLALWHGLLFAAGLLLFPRTAWAGALLAAGVMVGAIGSHLTKLGIVVQNDGGLLFALALSVFFCSLVAAFISACSRSTTACSACDRGARSGRGASR